MLAACKAGGAINPQLQRGEDEDGKKFLQDFADRPVQMCICVAFVLLQQLQ